MKKIAKLLIILIALVIIIYAAASIVLNHFVSPRTYQAMASQLASDYVGEDVKVTGDFNLSFFPWPAVVGKNIKISNPSSFPAPKNAPYLLNAKNIKIQFAFWPLLIGNVHPKRVVFNNTEINLVTLPSGKTNWRKNLKKNPNKQSSKKKSKKLTPENLGLAIPALPMTRIKNTNLHIINLQSGQKIDINDIDINNSELTANKKMDFNIQFHLAANRPLINAAIRVHGKINLNQETFQINILNVKIGQSEFNATVFAKQFMHTPKLNGHIDLHNINLQQLLTDFKLNPNVMPLANQNITASANYSFTDHLLRINQIKAKLNDSALTGDIKYRMATKKNTLNFNIYADKLNLKKAQQKQARQKHTQTSTINSNKKTTTASTKIPAPPLLQLKQFAANTNWTGLINIKRLNYENIHISRFIVNTTNKSGDIRLQPISMKIDQGNLLLRGKINTAYKRPRINLSFLIQDVPAQAIATLLKENPKITGKVNFNTDVKTSGLQKNDLLRNLRGTGQLRISQGELLGFDIGQQFSRGYTFIKKTAAPQFNTRNGTSFSFIKSNFQFNRGYLHNYSILLSSPNLNANGRGALNLITNKLRYRFILHSKTVENFAVPILVNGTLNHPNIQLDLVAIGKMFYQQKLKEDVQKSIGNIFRGKVNLKNLFP